MLADDPGAMSARLEQLRLIRSARDIFDHVVRELPEWETTNWRGLAAEAARAREAELRVAVTSAQTTKAAAEQSAARALGFGDG